MNWGHAIIIVFILFAAGILTLVTKSMRTRIDMVTPDYYAEELKYQQVIDGRQLAQTLSAPVKVSQAGNRLSLTFPPEMQDKPLTGKVLFYRASDARKDVALPLQRDENGRFCIDKERFTAGSYQVQLQWHAGGRLYVQEAYIEVR